MFAMTRLLPRSNARTSTAFGRLMTSGSVAALALAASFMPAPAKAQQAFGTMVGMQAGRIIGPNGQVSVWSGAQRPVIGTAADGRPLMSIEQTQKKALLDWEDFRLQTNEILEFRQQAADWIAVNRVHGDQASRIDGEIRAQGRVYVFNDNGVLIGKDAKINTRALVTGKGFSDVLVDGVTTTLVQSKEKATLDWSNMSLQAGEILKFKQEAKNWIALNRSYSADVTKIDGKVEAPGNIYLVAPKGLSVDGIINAQQVVLSSLYMRDDQFESGMPGTGGLLSYERGSNGSRQPTFSNTWYYPGDDTEGTVGFDNYYDLMKDGPEVVDLNNPLKYNVTIGRSGSITTGEFGKVMLFGPNVTNKGTINVRDEGQVILAAGENIYLQVAGSGMLAAGNGRIDAYVGAYNPMQFMRSNIPYRRPPQQILSEEWRAFYSMLLGKPVTGDALSDADWTLVSNSIVPYINRRQAERAREVGYTARNEGIINSKRGGSIVFRGLNLEQMGAIDMTSTALFRADINFFTSVWDWWEYGNGDIDGRFDGNVIPGHGKVTFGVGSLTQITPDLESTDAIPVTEGPQSVGSLKINANSVHMQEDALIHMPSGTIKVLLDASKHVFDNNVGEGANQGNEDGTRFLMDRGATIDLSGWDVELEMGYHQVSGKLFAAQLADSPVQRDGPLYRKQITVDRRYGTNLANWESFDNLSQGTLAQFLTNGGKLSMNIGDDFIMKSGSVIDVSGGVTTYKDGYVYSTMLRRLDGSIIDIREADPDELYMGLANEWVQYDTKWGRQKSYYIPLMSSLRGRYETSYQQGGKGGSIEILAPDAVLQGTLRGETVAGRYQRNNIPAGGIFTLNDAGNSEGEYVSNNILITAAENALAAEFGFYDRLSDTYGDLFGEEFDRESDPIDGDSTHNDNTTLTSADFFNRSTMGSYYLRQSGRVKEEVNFPPADGVAVLVEEGANLNLANGASLTLFAGERLEFLGSFRSEGGNLNLGGMSLRLGEDTHIDTRGSWYSDYEVLEPIALTTLPRINGGNVTLSATGDEEGSDDIGLFLPDRVRLDLSGGAWVDRRGKLISGKGGNLTINAFLYNEKDTLQLDGLAHARAYGLGGNGGFELGYAGDIIIGAALPEPEGEATGRQPLLIAPSFFENSGFSSVKLTPTGIVTLLEGTEVRATSANLQLKDQSLHNGVPPAYWTPSGTDIYDVAEPITLPIAQRPPALRRGMDITVLGGMRVEKNALLATEVGGKIAFSGSSFIAGTVSAPGGVITIGAGDDRSTVHLTSTAQILAPGTSMITWRGLDSSGKELVDGDIYNGGIISLIAGDITLDQGAVLDVSGTSATFDLPVGNDAGGIARKPVTLASDGGTILIEGGRLSINDALYRAQAGGAGARGGNFIVNWVPGYLGGSDAPVDYTTEQLFDMLAEYFTFGVFMDVDGNSLSTLYGTDLSRVDWLSSLGTNIEFQPGTVIEGRESALADIVAYETAAKGVPPMLVVGDASDLVVEAPPLPDFPSELFNVIEGMFSWTGYKAPVAVEGDPIVSMLSPTRISQGGFSALTVNASPGIIFSGDVNLGGKKADGAYIFDTIALNAESIIGRTGSKVTLEAGVIELGMPLNGRGGGGDSYHAALTPYGVKAISDDTRIDVTAGTLLQVASARFHGFENTLLSSGGDIRFSGYANPGQQFSPITGALYTPGKLTLKADQVYAGTGRIFTVLSDTGIEILPQDDGGPINGSPYEAAAQLTLTAPTIVQGGILRSPLGTLTLEAFDNGMEGSGSLIFKPGSLTSVSAEGKTIPYGYTSNGDSWIDPFTGIELTTLPAKTLNLTADKVDLQEGSVIDVSGGGDLYAREFVPGVNGTTDWLTGYRDVNYDWVDAPDEIYAIIPDFEGNIAPLGFGASQLGIGDKVYLSGGGDLAAGYYTLLPAEYALLPGAYRVTTKHRFGDFTDVRLGQIRHLSDGSMIQAGYRVDGASNARDQRNQGFHVMPGETLRERSLYRETLANSFFTSEAYLKKALRVNRPVGDVPRVPLDGGSVVFKVAEKLNIDGRLISTAAKGGRGGFADIDAAKVVVTGVGTDTSQYDGYLILDAKQLSDFGAASLLIGGVRRQGVSNLELAVSGTDIVVDNGASVLFAPELLFASSGNIDVRTGSQLETRGEVGGVSGDLRIVPKIPQFIDEKEVWTKDDDELVHGVLDMGTLLRISSGEQIDILRDTEAVRAFEALRNDPQALAALNDRRVSFGLAPLDPNGGVLTIADGVSIKSGRSVAFDATVDTILSANATVNAQQLSASASRVSIGAVPDGMQGLVFADGSVGALGRAADLTLKSYSSIDIYGEAQLATTGGLRLDAGEIRVLDAGSGTVTFRAKTLTLANSGGTATATAGDATLALQADNVYFEGADKSLSGIRRLEIAAKERVIGRDDSTLYVPGEVSISTGGLAAESGARLFIEAANNLDVVYNGNAMLPPFQSFGGTLGLSGASLNYAGQARMTGGTITLQARAGDVVLADGSVLDVTSNVSKFFDKTVGVGAGSVNLVADLGNVIMNAGSLIDVSGSSAGGDAGALTIKSGVGQALLGGEIRGTSVEGFRSGSFSLLTHSLPDFAGFNAALDAGGFRQSRRFEINNGDVTVNGTVNVQDFAVVANDGSIDVTGTVATVGDNGGRIQLAAAEDVVVSASGQLLARARTTAGAGGTVLLETTGRNGGRIATQAGSLIDVSGTGEGGRLIRFRAPQIGNDVAIDHLAGTLAGARSVIAEGFRVYDGISTIDQSVIDTVSNDAIAFMGANAAAIRNRIGSGVTLTAGIELRSDGDMELTDDWDLSNLRFDGAAGVLTLRAAGDLLINANLSDGFSGGTLLNGDSWALNLAAGANVSSPDSMAVLPTGLLAEGKGSVIVGGTPDTIEYFYDPAYGNENRLYVLDENGKFVRDPAFGLPDRFLELERDQATGKYINPTTGALIEKDPVTGDYVDTASYSRRPLPWIYYTGNYKADGTTGYVDINGLGYTSTDMRMYQQWNNSTGYLVRTGTGAVNVAAGADLILRERASVIYTAGRMAAEVADFHAPAGAQYGQSGGDINLRIVGDIIASAQTPQLPTGYMKIRGSLDEVTGLFPGAADRPYDQTSWWVDYGNFQGGVGALGGGNIDISAGGDISNLSVSIPNSLRVSGNTQQSPQGVNDPLALHFTGGGDLTLKAGGNIAGGAFYVAEGKGDLTAGGSIVAGSKALVFNDPSCDVNNFGGCYIHFDPRATSPAYDLHSMFFTSSGQFDIKSGGDLNIEGVLDPMMIAPDDYTLWNFTSFTDKATVNLFSAGGDITMWNNSLNMAIAYYGSGATKISPSQAPLIYYGQATSPDAGRDASGWDLRPSQISAVAATGNIRVLGGMTLLPAARGNLELLAGGNLIIGYGTTSEQDRSPGMPPYLVSNRKDALNHRGTLAYEGIYMSQADMDLIRTPDNPLTTSGILQRVHFRNAGMGFGYPGIQAFTIDSPPDLHIGDTEPVRLYAATGDIVTAGSTDLYLPKMSWFQAGGNIYFPSYSIQHNNPGDLSIVRAGKGIYFDIPQELIDTNAGMYRSFGHLSVAGPGRLEIEAGTDIYLPSNGLGITSRRIQIFRDAGSSNRTPGDPQDWKPDEQAADIAISTGYNQTPSYLAFEDAYLNPEKTAEMEDYLLDETGKSLYLFDRKYKRADGATGEFAIPEPREGLVNYVRRLQGLDPLKTKAEEIAYLNTAWSYWQQLSTDYKTPFYRSVLFLELRTTGREGNDPKSERFETSFRGYNAIAALFPGAEKESGIALAEGESAWKGDFETYASRVISSGGGKVEFVIPGGAMTLANVAALPGETGQPASPGDRGDALRSGVVTTDGGEINIMSHNSVTVNESRVLTTKGGNVMIWSSWGDIAAGKGAKTSISPSFYNYDLDEWARMEREPAGLPTGAGIGTVATQPGTRPADVDLVAPQGIVDAGDAGIRVSGNFNVFAVEVLGTDNIDVAGVATGLPAPPAIPPTSLATNDVGAKAGMVDSALDAAVSQVRQNGGIISPSIIEVRVTGYGEGCDGPCPPEGGASVTPKVAPPPVVPTTPLAQIGFQTEQSSPIAFNIASQKLDDAVRAVGRIANLNILYDASLLKARIAPALSGNMTPEQALQRLVAEEGLIAVRVGPRTIMLRRKVS